MKNGKQLQVCGSAKVVDS